MKSFIISQIYMTFGNVHVMLSHTLLGTWFYIYITSKEESIANLAVIGNQENKSTVKTYDTGGRFY